MAAAAPSDPAKLAADDDAVVAEAKSPIVPLAEPKSPVSPLSDAEEEQSEDCGDDDNTSTEEPQSEQEDLVADLATQFPSFRQNDVTLQRPVAKIATSLQDALSKKLQERQDRQQLVNKFILRDTQSSANLFDKQKQLTYLLQKRRSIGSLVKVGVLKDADVKSDQLSDAANAQRGRAMEEKERKKQALNQFFSNRPSPRSLISKRILIERESPIASNPVLKETQLMLGKFIGSRPSPQQLLESKIITDIGDLPSDDLKESIMASQLLPKLVDDLDSKRIVYVDCGWGHTGAVDDKGRLYTFGLTANGRLGLGADTQASHPHPDLNISLQAFGPVRRLACGDNHSATIVGHTVYTWGCGSWGRLGHGDQKDLSSPAPVLELKGEKIKKIACGGYHTLAMSESGSLFAFGWNKSSRLGIDTTVSDVANSFTVLIPQPVIGFSSSIKIRQIGAGQAYSVALSEDGRVFTWGSAQYGVLGHPSTDDQPVPRVVEKMSAEHVTLVGCGACHVLALAKSGRVYAWGTNSHGQLGRKIDGDTKLPSDSVVVHSPRLAPSSPTASGDSKAAESSAKYNVIKERLVKMKQHGTLQDAVLYEPAPVSFAQAEQFDADHVTWLAAGKSHSAVVSGGRLYTWGMGARGVLGHGNEVDLFTPTLVKSLLSQQICRVACSWSHSAAVSDSGKLFTWGSKEGGKLGY